MATSISPRPESRSTACGNLGPVVHIVLNQVPRLMPAIAKVEAEAREQDANEAPKPRSHSQGLTDDLKMLDGSWRRAQLEGTRSAGEIRSG